MSSLHQPRLFDVIPGEALGVGSRQPAASSSLLGLEDAKGAPFRSNPS